MSAQTADVIISGGRVLTMDDSPRQDGPRSIAIAGGRILAVGEADAVLAAHLGPNTELHDAAGQTVTPGLIDAHLHPIQGVEIVRGVDLGGVNTLDGLLSRLRAEAARVRAGQGDGWVRAWNLDYAAFQGRPYAAATIDAAVAGLPALILFFDVHTAVASSEALRIAGIDGARSFADTSEIVVDAAGRPTGELREESAFNLVLHAQPQPSQEEVAREARAILLRLRRSGVTGGVIMDGSPDSLDLLDAIDAGPGGLPVRLQSAMIHNPGTTEAEHEAILAQRDRAGQRWRGGLIKLFIDGVIDNGTGWLYEPDTAGEGLTSFWGDVDAFRETVRRYTAAGFQIATHAIGDRAIGETITAYLASGVAAAGRPPHRIEHVECLADPDLARMAEHGITASLQMLHMQWRLPEGADAWATRLGPERAAKAWPAGSIVGARVPLALGSDWPVADLDARLGLAWAVLRRTPGDPDAPVFEPHERLTPEQALMGYTRAAALAQGDDDLGLIAPGARADLAIWASDPSRATGDELISIPVTATYLDGERLENTPHRLKEEAS
ncbi:amidohydrolase [Leucobacter sp. M11]|uniref:amidohydrolase n=1 Tax=Leucobacter sp. M11 TaxID=2993565 RepID=UPI002D7FB701|nr:amidohydrolase [Leucobacter sp. M11]MEB4614792.1 amidohydrolase [Leucobacter sp. M11]